MSDQVDDIEGAEDWIGTLETFVRKIAALPVVNLAGQDRVISETAWLVKEAVGLLGDGNRYCRPTCGFLTDGTCLSGEDTCGCPCGHDADAVDEAAEQPSEGWAMLVAGPGTGAVRTLKAHWWKDDGTGVCDAVAGIEYRGSRSTREPEGVRICRECQRAIG